MLVSLFFSSAVSLGAQDAGGGFLASSGRAKVIIECVENYGSSSIETACDAAHAFKSALSDGNQNSFYFRIYENSLAWPSDFWTAYARGSPYYPGYHTYRYHYPIFIGHGGQHYIAFSVARHNHLTDVWTKLVHLDNIVNGYPETHFKDVGGGAHPLWVLAASCDTLLFWGTPYTDPNLEYFIRASFNGGADSIDNLSSTYLHGFLGMRTPFTFILKAEPCTRIDVASETFNKYAEYLKNGEPIVFAWSDAVYDKQYRDYTLCCLGSCHTWHLRNKAAAVYPVIIGFDSRGRLRFLINYGVEKLYPISQEQPFMDPRDAVEYILQNGWTPYVSWNYYYYPRP